MFLLLITTTFDRGNASQRHSSRDLESTVISRRQVAVAGRQKKEKPLSSSDKRKEAATPHYQLLRDPRKVHRIRYLARIYIIPFQENNPTFRPPSDTFLTHAERQQ